MLNLLKTKPAPKVNNEARALVRHLSKENENIYPFKLNKFPSGERINKADDETKRQVVLALIEWIEDNRSQSQHRQNWRRFWKMQNTLFTLLKRRLPFTEGDVLYILDWSRKNSNYWYGIPQIIKVLSDHLKENELTEPLEKHIRTLIRAIEGQQPNARELSWVIKLRKMAGNTEICIPINTGDVWADAALEYIRGLEPEQKNAWAELLLNCLRVSGSKPSKKWMEEAKTQIKAIGQDEYRSTILNWYKLASEPRLQPAFSYGPANDQNLVWYLDSANNDLLKGMVWTCSRDGDGELARALTTLALTCYKKIPGFGQRAGKVGNACFWALGEIPGMDGIAQLSILKLRLKNRAAQNAIARALSAAAKRAGLSDGDIEEFFVPDYGLQEVGQYQEEFEGYSYELRIHDSTLEQTWRKGTGNERKQLKSVPKAVREGYPEELKAIKIRVNDIRKMMPAQRNRIDNLYLTQKTWKFNTWQDRYIKHPLVGTIGRRLIWKFSQDDRAASGIWFDGRFVERNGLPLDWLSENTTVELWHPINVDPDIVLEWRIWLAEHEVQQPFKQAHREVYLLTEAERNTRVYSNRYAAHILRQHQFNALCAARGWKNSLRLMVDNYYDPAMKELPPWNLRVEYWIEGIGDNYGTDTNETGTYLYVTTDQVRFYAIDTQPNSAHASGGGYGNPGWRRRENNPESIPLDDIPPLVFSEIMRDVDMFVGVASLGNDPNWLDGGPEVRYRDYWHSYSFGELTESAKTRKQVLEFVLPRLKIADRCKLAGKFLEVRGDIRTYKIHLGSGNILMKPNDQYLCIVPARGEGKAGQNRIFLPFEGDQTLAVILSKAFMLAEDKKITDSTIIRQIER